MRFALVSVLTLAACADAPQPVLSEPATAEAYKATVSLEPTDGFSAAGTLTLARTAAGALVSGTLTGVAPGAHGLHVHETGDCADNAAAAGGHLDPYGAPHGPPSTTSARRHVGDLGNVVADSDSTVVVEIADAVLDPEQIVGRAVVLHSGPDDYTSQPSGAAGDRVACGVVR